MRSLFTIFAIFAIAVGILAIINECHNMYTKDMEKAYFEGQKDAIEGDVRIKKNKDSIYIWEKSPWNNGSKPLYNPDYLDSQK